MAHRTSTAAVNDVLAQQRTSYRVIIVWRKDWERWADELLAAIDRDAYDVRAVPEQRTKNQLIVAEKNEEAVAATLTEVALERRSNAQDGP